MLGRNSYVEKNRRTKAIFAGSQLPQNRPQPLRISIRLRLRVRKLRRLLRLPRPLRRQLHPARQRRQT